jgi:hypothetical protein
MSDKEHATHTPKSADTAKAETAKAEPAKAEPAKVESKAAAAEAKATAQRDAQVEASNEARREADNTARREAARSRPPTNRELRELTKARFGDGPGSVQIDTDLATGETKLIYVDGDGKATDGGKFRPKKGA